MTRNYVDKEEEFTYRVRLDHVAANGIPSEPRFMGPYSTKSAAKGIVTAKNRYYEQYAKYRHATLQRAPIGEWEDVPEG